MERKTEVITISLWQAFAALLTLLPLLFLNISAFTGNTDALFYTIILKLTAHHMAQGEMWPGWLSEANGATGSPVLFFYSRLACQLTAILGAPLAFIDPLGWKRLVLGMFAAQWVGGMAAWMWLSRFGSRRAALVASVLFTLFPYKWIYIYLHINLAQLWALAWLPPLMMAAEDMRDGKRAAPVWYGLWLGLLALTHPPTLVAFGAVPAIYVLVFSRKRLAELASAHLVALALSACYWLPALLNKSLVQAGQFTREQWNYAGNLSHYDLLLNFHYAVIAALVIGLMLHGRQMREHKRELFWLAALGVVTFLCLRISRPLWDVVTPLQFLQFPAARFHAVALMAACALTVFCIDCVHKPSRLYSLPVLLGAVAVMTIFDLHYVYGIYKRPTDINAHYIEQVHALDLIVPQEYLTRWQPRNAGSLARAASNSELPLAFIAHGTGSASAYVADNGEIHIRADILSPEALLQVRQLYWPGWRSSGVAPEAGADGFLTLRLPQGRQSLTLSMGALAGEFAGGLISLLGWLAMLLFFCAEWTRDSRRMP